MATAGENLRATVQRHWEEQWELRLERHLWPPTYSQGLKELGRNQIHSLKSFVLLYSLVSVGRGYLYEYPKHQTINVFSSLGIMTIHQRIIRDWFMNESDYRPNIIYELGQTWIFHAGQTKKSIRFSVMIIYEVLTLMQPLFTVPMTCFLW